MTRRPEERVVAIIQARMGSSRLPGKMLMPLAGTTVIRHVVDRARRIEGVHEVRVATTDTARDDALASHCRDAGIPVFRGDEQDVLKRYADAARDARAGVVMRITGDCPLLDPAESARVLRAFLAAENCEYASNIEPPFLPDGLDTEVIRASTLYRLSRDVDDPALREHVTLFIRRHPERFNTLSITGEPDLSSLRWTLDEEADYRMLSSLFDILKRENREGGVADVLDVLRRHPEIAETNAGLERNAAIKQIP